MKCFPFSIILLMAVYVVYDIVCFWFCFRSGWNGTACLLVIVNDILDHVDGIVAKVHKEQYGQIDDPMFGAFIDAFCDKVNSCTLQSALKERTKGICKQFIGSTVKLSCFRRMTHHHSVVGRQIADQTISSLSFRLTSADLC